MAEKYFEKFPIIQYANNYVRNITERAVVLNSVYNSPVLYYAYDIGEGERPDNIADRYYNDEYMGWILHLTNKVIDPYYDWYIDQTTFKDFIVKKYGSYVNAVTKVKYYRNNWYSYPDPISNLQFNSITETLKKFYEPIYSDIYQSTTPLGYKRKPIDWKRSTNNVVSYNVDGTDYIINEIVNVYRNSTLIGSGQVCGKSSTALTIQHTSGIVTEDTGINTMSVVGKESNESKVYTNATLLVGNIPSEELNYWDPVYLYDYENEINERNKTIQVLKSEYSGKLAKELKTLLR
jgi:hypothetical protein